jgi:hypothetical protein
MTAVIQVGPDRGSRSPHRSPTGKPDLNQTQAEIAQASARYDYQAELAVLAFQRGQIRRQRGFRQFVSSQTYRFVRMHSVASIPLGPDKRATRKQLDDLR